MKTKSSSKARSELCAVVAEASKGSPTTISKRGRPVAIVISIETPVDSILKSLGNVPN
ncbi:MULTISPECIES: type II toxin-antitoxin system Phd/YefM family antitoxin [unclassified Mesorhizobium]|uniref:type II toxin-antitoxin system Phd/YefM family antitoxin n=1 Tax=unclassified Mesorhizobium TaxID=325217 RepID=UPI00112AD358|nr:MULTISPECIES: type II toxin-antitoxin system prevent-host-death family antitoxin [unclassified Mesorhizobium]MCA0001805.1 type II toxin-antitoxin system Phd/YefM family antitoxin [Mesorhizobium sp. B264B2A]MCA0007912.1 type II toxin-antitoxin system Phd/YefM family antitoxin [Mesorhizobium sp. B264B1B]MCA0017367.1 type II toxin-antitoxin system Phd/YefM family antitoxin [Mesorhizobium sp. B264B1A]TPJ50190.1 type II toxin-antitoxin system Phd/YefM family antitoxin [Mesorhizobium sp. B2-6-6]